VTSSSGNAEKDKFENSKSEEKSLNIKSVCAAVIDPALLNPSRSTFTDVIDKVLTSTPRLIAIANLLLAVTYLLHSAIADLFLLNLEPSGGESSRELQQHALNHRRAGRERLGGFLVFKLLLISAVVEPDTLDLLILLSWYTLLSFLRSLAHLASATTAHTSQAGQPPARGVLRLLSLLLVADTSAAASCLALFHPAGLSMVLLLEADCALLAIDLFSHMAKHAMHTMEDAHQHLTQTENHDHLQRLEERHTRRLALFDAVVFALELTSLALTVAHFLHIWSLHGLSFGLVDCVLALHLHTAIAAAGKKIALRRNLNKIHRDLNGYFSDATELDMRKAHQAGDVCCICLGTMSASNVKKVPCGHLYHTHCLKEVVERARSIHAARCPLCRASLVPETNDSNNATVVPVNQENVVPENNAPVIAQPMNGNGGEHALFRFSTEGILPAWLPLPAFSFEVVRRPSNTGNNEAVHAAPAAPAALNNPAVPPPQPAAEPPQPQPPLDPPLEQPPQNQPNPETSFWRRLLILAGAIPMSPEEEAAAIAQLVDMFPQYQRADLLRELRDRGSPEAVVEAVLTGVFSGVPTNGAFAEVATAAVVADVIATDGGVDVNQEGEEQINAQVDDNQENEPLEPPPIQQQTETDDIVTPIDTNENITNLLMFGEQEQLQTNENTTTENDNAEDEQ